MSHCELLVAGANQPWLHYGADFGEHRPTEEDFCTLKNNYLVPLQRAGGHTLRFWLFVEGSGGIPQWAPDGLVNGTDAAGSLADDMRRFVRLAASMDIVVVWCLWNGAVLRDNRTISMIVDPSGAALKSFVEHALTPLVTALKSEPVRSDMHILFFSSCSHTQLINLCGAGDRRLGNYERTGRICGVEREGHGALLRHDAAARYRLVILYIIINLS